MEVGSIPIEEKTLLENNLEKIASLWSLNLPIINNHILNNDSISVSWERYEVASKQYFNQCTTCKLQLKEIELKLKETSSIEVLKDCAEKITDIKRESCSLEALLEDLLQYDVEFQSIKSEELIKIVETVMFDAHKLLAEIKKSFSKRVIELKYRLNQWSDYTLSTRDLMAWLRNIEESIKQPLHNLSVADLEHRLKGYQEFYLTFESYRHKHDHVIELSRGLSRGIISEEQYHLEHQLKSMNTLWSNISTELKDKMSILVQLLDSLDQFNYKYRLVDTFMSGIERSLSTDHANPERQKDRINRIYGTDIKDYATLREDLKKLAVNILSYGSTCSFAHDIKDKFQTMKTRWKCICESLGISYEQAEETIFLLQLFEQLLKQLNNWLNTICHKLKHMNLTSTNLAEMEHTIRDLKIMVKEFNNRENDCNSVTELCDRIQQLPEACPYTQDVTNLFECSNNFKLKWNETRDKCTVSKAILERRLNLYEEWNNDVVELKGWMKTMEENKNNRPTEHDVAKKLLQRIKDTANVLTNQTTGSCKISRITFEITKTYHRLVSSFDHVAPLLEHVTSSLDYSQLQNEMEIWLNEMEIEVIRLRPYALSITEQSEKIQKLQEIIKEKSDWFENLNRSSFNQSGYEDFDQLNQRYLQLLDDSETLLTDFAMTSSLSTDS